MQALLLFVIALAGSAALQLGGAAPRARRQGTAAAPNSRRAMLHRAASASASLLLVPLAAHAESDEAKAYEKCLSECIYYGERSSCAAAAQRPATLVAARGADSAGSASRVSRPAARPSQSSRTRRRS